MWLLSSEEQLEQLGAKYDDGVGAHVVVVNNHMHARTTPSTCANASSFDSFVSSDCPEKTVANDSAFVLPDVASFLAQCATDQPLCLFDFSDAFLHHPVDYNVAYFDLSYGPECFDGFMQSVASLQTSHVGVNLVATHARALHLRGGMPKDDDESTPLPMWNCKRGAPFEAWALEAKVYLSGKWAQTTDDDSVYSALTGEDQGGDAVGARAMPAGAGLPGAQRARNRRQQQAWSYLCRMVPVDSDVRKLLLDLVIGDFAPPAGAVAAPGGMQGIGRRAYLVLIRQGREVMDDEFIIAIRQKYDNATILGTVGYDQGSISEFSQRLNRIVYLVPNAQSTTE